MGSYVTYPSNQIPHSKQKINNQPSNQKQRGHTKKVEDMAQYRQVEHYVVKRLTSRFELPSSPMSVTCLLSSHADWFLRIYYAIKIKARKLSYSVPINL